jgi:tryptophan-rich sensory protein
MDLPLARRRSTPRDLLTALGFVLLVNLVGAAPALLAGPDSAWFAALEKPAIYPPSVTFGVVWTLLFTLSGVALWLVWSAPQSPARRTALALFVVQFALNVAWTPTFFGAQMLLAGLGVIVALAFVLAGTVAAFARVDRRAALLLVPYLGWVCFAALLNYRFLVLNA